MILGSFVIIIALSVIFSWAFTKSKNILVPISLHMSWNLMVCLLFGKTAGRAVSNEKYCTKLVGTQIAEDTLKRRQNWESGVRPESIPVKTHIIIKNSKRAFRSI